ncbi:hypothetical protein [Streptomyces spiralis]|uniref:hypothetical protein n=1 Tax=Streptomyces spiralis TaxID=66376 RepID=UPI0036901DF8
MCFADSRGPQVEIVQNIGRSLRPNPDGTARIALAAGYARWITARMLPSRSAADLIAARSRSLTELGAIPRALVWDNGGAVGSRRSGGPRLTAEFAAFARLAGIKFPLCKPRDPEAKGVWSSEPTSGDVVSARAGVPLAGGPHHPARRLADQDQPCIHRGAASPASSTGALVLRDRCGALA